MLAKKPTMLEQLIHHLATGQLSGGADDWPARVEALRKKFARLLEREKV